MTAAQPIRSPSVLGCSGGSFSSSSFFSVLNSMKDHFSAWKTSMSMSELGSSMRQLMRCVMAANMVLYPMREMTWILVLGHRQVASSAGPFRRGAFGCDAFSPLGAPLFRCFLASFTAFDSDETSFTTLSFHEVPPLLVLATAAATLSDGGALGLNGFTGGCLAFPAAALDTFSVSPLPVFFLAGLRRFPNASRADAIFGRCLAKLNVVVLYSLDLAFRRSHPLLPKGSVRRRSQISPERAGWVNPWPQLRWTVCA